MRNPYQILLIPFSLFKKELYVYIFKRSNGGWWQFVSGGGEDEESIAETVLRELEEETGIRIDGELIELQAIASIPVSAFNDKFIHFKNDTYVIPEYSFAVNIEQSLIQLSNEHSSFRFVKAKDAYKLLRYDSNKTALFELEQLFINGKLWERHYDCVKPRTDWVFNNGVAQVFHNMLKRSIPELDMMRNLVTMYGSKYIQPGGTI